MKTAKMKKSIGEFIHNLRIEYGLTLTQLGAKLDIDSDMPPKA